MYESSELKDFKNINLLGELPTNWSNELLRINVYKTLESCC